MGAEETTHFLAQRKRGWPLSTLFLDTAALPPLATTPPSAGTSGDRPCADPPADYCMQPAAKAERGPIATSGPSLLVCHRTRLFLQTKSIRFSPLAAAQLLTILSGPETLNLLFLISRNSPQQLGVVSPELRASKLDVLGFEFEMGLVPHAQDEARTKGVSRHPLSPLPPCGRGRIPKPCSR